MSSSSLSSSFFRSSSLSCFSLSSTYSGSSWLICASVSISNVLVIHRSHLFYKIINWITSCGKVQDSIVLCKAEWSLLSSLWYWIKPHFLSTSAVRLQPVSMHHWPVLLRADTTLTYDICFLCIQRPHFQSNLPIFPSALPWMLCSSSFLVFLDLCLLLQNSSELRYPTTRT